MVLDLYRAEILGHLVKDRIDHRIEAAVLDGLIADLVCDDPEIRRFDVFRDIKHDPRAQLIEVARKSLEKAVLRLRVCAVDDIIALFHLFDQLEHL